MNETDEPIYIPQPAIIDRSTLTDFIRFCEAATGTVTAHPPIQVAL
jgi:hypothetical protein